jgi:photosystem II stability/assembly factor-like uncharacterized protein
MRNLAHLFLIIVLCLSLNSLKAQEWYKDLMETKTRSELTLDDFSEAFNNYWAPYNVDRGYYYVNGEKKKAGGWKQFKRWEHYMEGQVDPLTGAFPEKSARQIYREYIRNGGSQSATRSASWTSMGPSSTPGGYAGLGRINCVAFHPSDNDIYWVGAASGGLWVTTDNGSSWTCLTDENGVLAVSDIIIPSDFASSNTIYIATGDRDAFDNNSIGVLKSTDGGATWNTTGITFNMYDYNMVNRLLLDPNDDQTIIAATTQGVYKTTNGGATWSNQLTAEAFIDMEYEPGNFDRLYGSNKNGGIYMSSDGGANWSQTFYDSDARRIELAVSMNNVNVVYAVAANSSSGLYGVYASTNKAASFSMVFDGSVSGNNLLGWESAGDDTGGQGWYDLAIAASPTDVNTVLIGGINTWRSTNGGGSWSIVNHWWGDGVQAVHADKHNLTYRDDGTLFEVNDGGIYLSSNEGTSWTDESVGLVISQMYKLGVSALDESEVITGLQDNGSKLLLSSNWYDVKGGDGMECLIDYSDNDIQYATYTYGQITRTTDKWLSTTDIEPSAAGDGAWVTPYIIHPTNPATLFAGYADVWKTTDRGSNWTKISTMNTSDKMRSMAISQSDPNTLYVADSYVIWKTTDGGTNWTEISASLPTSAGITSLAVKHDDPDVVWVTYGAYNSNRIYQSTDGGSNWTNISTGLPNIPIYSIVQNVQVTGEVHLYVGTELGVYLKKGTDNWVEYGTNLPNVKIGELEIFYDSNPADSKLRAATYGRGLWETPVEYDDVDMEYVSSTTTQTLTSDVNTNTTDQQIIGVQIVTNGSLNPIDLTSITLNTNGTTNEAADISNAKLWYTGINSSFATGTQFGSSVVTPNGSFTLTGTQELAAGTNYFWLTYDINAAANVGNLVDAECNSVTVDGSAYNPSVEAPGGSRTIVSDPCLIATLPYSENFDAYAHGSDPDCWSKLLDNADVNVYEEAAFAHSDPNSMLFYLNDPSSIYLITPRIDEDLSLLRVEFYARYYTKSLVLEVGTMTDPSNSSTYTHVQDVNISSSINEMYTVDFDSYSGSDHYIAFRLRSDYNIFDNPFEAIFIDDVHIDYLPTCERPINLNASLITTSSALLSWDDVNGASNWNVEVGLTGFTPGTGTQVEDNSGETDQKPWTADGLSASQNYQFYVQADCGGGDLSTWAGPNNFISGCEAFSIPVFEDFNNLPHSVMPACWTIDATGNGVAWNNANNPSLAYSTDNFLILLADTDPAETFLISPQLDANISDLELEFYARWYNGGQMTLDVGTVSDPSNLASFNSVSQFIIANETYDLYTYDFSAYAGTDEYIAFRLSTNAGAQAGYVFLEDILIDYNYAAMCNVENLPFVEDFETTTVDQVVDLDCWTNFTEEGTQQWIAKSFSSNLYAQVSAFSSGEPSVKSWLISPPINMDNYDYELLTFETKTGYYVHDGLSLWISSDFDGSDPTTASWTELTATFATGPSGGYGSWVASGDVDLSSYSGVVNIAFLYEGDDASNTTTFQLDNISIVDDFTDIEVTEVYSLGKLPINFATPHTVKALVKNNGGYVATNFDVTMDITGDNAFTDVQTITTLAPGDSVIVSFAAYSPTVEGTQTCTVSVSADDDNGNNSDTYDIATTLNTFNYSEGDVADGFVGFNGETGDFVAKFSTTDAAILNQVDVIFQADGDSFKIGVWDDDGVDNTPGTLLYSSDEELTTAGRYTMLINPGVSLLAGDFYVGILQTGTTNVGFGFQEELPIRAETFYFASPTGSTVWNDFNPNNRFRLMIEPKFATPNDVSVLTASADDGQKAQPVDIEFEIINYGTDDQSNIPVYYSVDGGSDVGPVTITGPISMNGTQTGSFSGAFAYTPPDYGTYSVSVFTDLSTDEVPANDDYSFTLNVPQPEIFISETDFDFGTQLVGGSTSSETYRVDATNLISDLTITAPTGFEISLDDSDFSINPLVISPVDGQISDLDVYVRFTPLSNAAYDANVTHTATDATQVDLNVLGNGLYPTPVATVSNTPGCETGTVRVSSDLSGTQTFYLYNHDGSLEIANSGAVTADYYDFTGIADGTYTAKVERLGQTSLLSAQSVLSNYALPTAVISGGETICAGETSDLTVTLTGAQPWDITYSDGTTSADVNGISSSPHTISVLSAGNYTITAVSDAHCTGTSMTGSAVISVDNPPVGGTATADDLSLCSGNSTTINLTGSTGDIQWQDSEDNITFSDVTGENTASLSTGNISVTTYYRAVLSNGVCDDVYSSVATVTVSGGVPDAAGTISGLSSVCLGQTNVVYTVGAINNATIYDWTLPPGAVGSSTTNSISVEFGATASDGDIIVKGQNGCGDGIPSDMAITVNDLPTAAISGGETLCDGETTDLSVTLTGTAPWDITYSDGTTTHDVEDIGLSPYTLEVGTTGTYTLTAVSDAHCDGTDLTGSASVIVHDLPTATVSGSADICEGDNTIVSIDLTGTAPWDIMYSDGTYTHVESDITTSPFEIIVDEDAIYTVTAISDAHCSGTEMNGSATIGLHALPSASISGGASICHGETTDLTVALTGTSPWDISYSDGTTTHDVTGITSSPHTLSVGVDGTYSLTAVSDVHCDGTDLTGSASVTVYDLPTATVSGSADICEGDNTTVSIALTGTSPWDLSYSDGTTTHDVSDISVSPYEILVDEDGVYTVTAVSDAHCTGTEMNGSATIGVHALPSASISGGASICHGETTDLTVALTGTSPWDFTYSDGTTTHDVTGITSSPHTLSVGVDGTYSLTAVSDAHCDGTDLSGSAMVTVNSLPSASISGGASICDGETTDLTVALTGTSPWDISYSDGTTTHDVTGITSSPHTLSVGVDGTYSLTAVSDAHCDGTDLTGSASVTVYDLPTATVSGSADICEGENTTVSIALTGISPWDLSYSDGTTTYDMSDISASPYEILVDENGVYTVSAISDAHCTGTEMNGSAEVTVNALPNVECPDNFTVDVNEPVVLSGGTPDGGNYSGDGVEDGVFDPSLVVNGVYDVTYVYQDPTTGCEAECVFEITVDIGVHVLNHVQDETIIYPNPSDGMVYIEGSDIQTLTVTNVEGKVIHVAEDINDNSFTIDMSNYPKGIYMFKVATKNCVSVNKLILN